MNQRIIIIVVTGLLVVGAGGWFYFSSQQQLPSEQAQDKPQEEVGGPTAPAQEKAVSPQPEPSKQLTTIEKVTARSFAEKVLKLLQSRDYSKIYDLLTEEDKAAMTRTEYVKQATETSGTVTIKSWQIKEVLEEQNGASVQYILNYEGVLGSGSETGILALVQKSGKWFLSIGAIDVKKAVIKGLGDEIVLATIKFKVNAVNEQNSISSSNPYNQPLNAKEGAKLVVVDMSIINITKTSMTFPADAFTLVDNQDRQFTPIIAIGHIDNYLDGRGLSPSIPERGVVVFEIPQDAIRYGFVVVKAGTNEVYKVILK